MREYWLRVLAAWILLKFAQMVMKDAEKLLTKAANSDTVIEGTATEALGG
jgi:hypothetical protein